MKISFNLIGTGLANNGGSQTLILSANTLHELGCDVTIVDYGKNNNTWNPIKCNHLIIDSLEKFPDSDVIIGTGVGSISSTNMSKIKNKYLWIRGWETWNTPEDNLVKILKTSPTKKIVNSIGLQNKLKSYNIDSTIIRPGHDFKIIHPLNYRNYNKQRYNIITLGGLYNQGTKRIKKRTEWIFDTYAILRKKYMIELIMFGSDGAPTRTLDKYYKNPDIYEKNDIYNLVDIWLSPSELEGLHIPPAEAMLTECCVVGNNSELNGTSDYLIDHETGLVSDNNFDSFLSNVEFLINQKTIRTELGKCGRQKILSLGNRIDNMKKFKDLLNE